MSLKRFFKINIPFFVLFSSIVILFGKENDVLVVTHFSKVLGKEKTFRIYIPDKQKPNELFPILYVLHGAYCDSSAWIEQTKIEELAEDYRMILVFPDGEQFGWYVDSPYEKDSQYEAYIIKELIPLIDNKFPTIAKREGRSIMGASMGGHGAMTLAEKHPELFCSVSSFFGILKLTNHPDKWNIAEKLGLYEENKMLWEENSAYEQAEKLKGKDIKIFFDCGKDDTETGAIFDNRAFDQRLTELSIPHIWKEKEGGHNAEFLNQNLKEHLDFHWNIMKRARNNIKLETLNPKH